MNLIKKYKMTGETKEFYGRTLHRIEALRSFCNVKKGDKGGWIEIDKNLSQEGNCWVYHDARVFGNAKVYGVQGYLIMQGYLMMRRFLTMQKSTVMQGFFAMQRYMTTQRSVAMCVSMVVRKSVGMLKLPRQEIIV